MEWKDFKQEFEKRLNLQDPNCLEIIFATALAHRLPGDPVWLFWIAESGGGKTEVLRSFRDVPDMIFVESISDKGFISHFYSKDDKSLAKLLKNKCLIVKDFTTILEARTDVRKVVFSHLRGLYDGEFDSQTGVGYKSHKVKFGFIAGVTPIINERRSVQVALGERFLSLNTMTESDKARKKKTRDAMIYATKQPKMRDELRELTSKMMDSVAINKNISIGKDQHEWFVEMADFLARLRAHVPRDQYNKEISNEPIIELPTRLVGQLMRLFLALRLIVDKDDALKATARVVKDSIPTGRSKMVEYAIKNDGFRVDKFESKISESALHRHAEDLVALEVFERVKLQSGKIMYKMNGDLVEDAMGLYGGENVLRKQRPGMWE